MDTILFILGGIGIIVSLVLLVINLVRKKPKKKALIALAVCLVVFVVSLEMTPSSQDEKVTKVEADEEEQEEEPEEELEELTDEELDILSKKYAELTDKELDKLDEINEKYPNLDNKNQDIYDKEYTRIMEEKENAEWKEYVKDNTKELIAGKHTVGEHIESGNYQVTFKGNGNFTINTSSGSLVTNEIGGSSGIEEYKAILSDDMVIELSGMAAIFKPIKLELRPFEEFELHAGYWLVGEDLSPGRYKVELLEGSGNFIMYDSDSKLKANEVFGGSHGIEEMMIDLALDDLIQIGSVKRLKFTPDS